MQVADFDYDLPPELIAQHPTAARDHSRLMIVHKNSGLLEHKHFYDLLDYLHPGDILVRNNSKVIPARLKGVKEKTGAKVELLLLKEDGQYCECLCGNAKVIKVGTVIDCSGLLKAECVAVKDEGVRRFKLDYEGTLAEVLAQVGSTPLPPYIHEKLKDSERYQNVYAKIAGSAACPTAGLHFTSELLDKIQAKGVEILDVTLHVGLGTFKPVKAVNVEEHRMHSEYYELKADVAAKLNRAKAEGRRIIAVGTTSTRTLESVWQKYHAFQADYAETSIFIYPPYQFQAIDAQITNFHLPKSTLIMMIAAFAGYDLTMRAYREAVAEQYRFFSFGDSMFIDNE